MPADHSARAASIARANALIEYHGPISRALTDERTSLESKLIPVSAYIITACVEAYLRYPAMMRTVADARRPREIGAAARRPGCRVNTVHLWSIANFYLLGRKAWALVDPSGGDPAEVAEVLGFWEEAALGFRADGTRQAWDTGTAAVYPPEVIAALLAGVDPVAGDDERARLKRFNATLVAYLFLLYFDTRVGTGDTGPYPLPDGRVLLVRDYYQLGQSDFWWSNVARDMPYQNLTAALVLEGVDVRRITDFGTSYTEPEDYLDHLVGFGLFTTDPADGAGAGELRPVPLGEIDGIVAEVRKAQAAHYRAIVAMDRHEKIRCGAYVYFSFLRPFAQLAGVEAELDWTVPRDIPAPLYDLVAAMEGTNAGVEEEGPYYAPFPG